MPDQIKYDLSFTVVPGPPVSKKDMFNVAYLCKGGATIAPGDTRELIVPVCGPGKLQLVVLAADQYGEGLTYSKSGADDYWKLTMPVFLIGAGATSLLGNELPEALVVTNQLDKETTVTIYVGWDAMPEEEEETEEPEEEEGETPETPEYTLEEVSQTETETPPPAKPLQAPPPSAQAAS